MNRSAAQTARVLGVDPTQVKDWAKTFKEFLSLQANPPKETNRTFSDSDVMVLAYIWAHWEQSPDLEAIEAGLNSEDHHADAFREHLYLHTPLLQEPPDDLDETWRHGILLAGGESQEFLELARNYRHVADGILEAALSGGEPLDFAYPVLFAYRHTLELYLKIVGEIDEPTHSLKTCVRMVESRHGKKIGSPVRGWILELDKIDPRGTSFRYSGEESATTRSGEYWLDLVQFKFAMGLVFEMLDGAVLRLNMRGKAARKRK